MISLDSHNKPPTWHGGKYFPAEKWSSTKGKQAAQGHAPMVLQNQWHQRHLQPERNPAKESGSHKEDKTGDSPCPCHCLPLGSERQIGRFVPASAKRPQEP